MRAFVITAPGKAEVADVKPPVPGPGEVVVDIARVGLCGTDVEFFAGTMAYLISGEASFPIRIGHEWSGVVTGLGTGVDTAWLGCPVTGDTMLGCGRCHRCRVGRRHLCADRHEIGIRKGWAGALAEQLLVPAHALRLLPDGVDATAGALVEPGGNALRSVTGADLVPGERLLVLGTGTIGLLAAKIAAARGIEAHLLGLPGPSLDFARSLGMAQVWTAATLPTLRFDAVVDASNSPTLPALALDLVEPGRRVVYIGLAGEPSLVDTRTAVLKDLTVVGVLGASAGLTSIIDLYHTGAVDPRPLVAATVGLDQTAEVLAGERRKGWGHGPKIHVDPRR